MVAEDDNPHSVQRSGFISNGVFGVGEFATSRFEAAIAEIDQFFVFRPLEKNFRTASFNRVLGQESHRFVLPPMNDVVARGISRAKPAFYLRP